MKLNTYSQSILALLASTFLAAQSAEAAVTYHVTVDTSALTFAPGSADAPFALDFQLTGGNAFSNTVSITNFDFGVGGSANSNPTATIFGLGSGTLSSFVTLTDNTANFANEFYQGFTPGSTLSFDVNLTTNLNGPTPDAFSFTILDSTLANLATNGPGDSLLLININSAAPTPLTFSTASGVTVSAVPEPCTVIVGLALIGLCGTARHRRTA